MTTFTVHTYVFWRVLTHLLSSDLFWPTEFRQNARARNLYSKAEPPIPVPFLSVSWTKTKTTLREEYQLPLTKAKVLYLSKKSIMFSHMDPSKEGSTAITTETVIQSQTKNQINVDVRWDPKYVRTCPGMLKTFALVRLSKLKSAYLCICLSICLSD